MKKILVFAFCLLIILNFKVNASAEELSLSAKAAVVICADSRDIVYGKNINMKLPMASTTKIMTALMLAEQRDLTKTVKITREMVLVEGSSMGLKIGDTVSYLDLIYGMLLPSGNDAANVTAFALGGSVENFADLMNKKAKDMGLKNTSFVTPSGLDAENHYTTAYDLAKLTAYALENPVFKEVCSSYRKTLSFGEPKVEHTYQNHNKLLKSYDGMIGVKTGFTKKAGRCLVTAAERNGVTLIAVTLSAPNDWQDHPKMLDFGFENVVKTVVKADIPDSISVISGDCDKAKITTESVEFSVTKKNVNNIKAKTVLPKFLYSKINAGEKVGSVEYHLNGELLTEKSIISKADVLLLNKQPPLGVRFKENIVKLLRLVV